MVVRSRSESSLPRDGWPVVDGFRDAGEHGPGNIPGLGDGAGVPADIVEPVAGENQPGELAGSLPHADMNRASHSVLAADRYLLLEPAHWTPTLAQLVAFAAVVDSFDNAILRNDRRLTSLACIESWPLPGCPAVGGTVPGLITT